MADKDPPPSRRDAADELPPAPFPRPPPPPRPLPARWQAFLARHVPAEPLK